MNDVYHYPPDLFELVVQTIPLLNRGKRDVLTFFKGAGIDSSLFKDLTSKVEHDSKMISKYEICRTILERINEDSDRHLRERREILKRITEFEAFSTCWESDQLKAKGLVSEIQKVIHVKDSLTRMQQERDKELEARKKEYHAKIEELNQRKLNLANIKSEFFALFAESNPQKRGKALENVLNKYFKTYQILVRENFTRLGDASEGVIEQVDGIIEVDNQIFLVEMKWKKDPIAANDIFSHLGRIYHRAHAHGIFISDSGYTASGTIAAKEALIKNALLVLFDLEELVTIIDNEVDFLNYLREKIKVAIVEKNPYKKLPIT